MIILTVSLVIVALSFLLWKLPFFRNTGLKSWQVLSAFYLKLVVACVFFAVYNYSPAFQNQSDSQAFYRSAAQFSAIAHDNFGDYARASFHIPVKSPEIRKKLDKIAYWNRPYDSFMPNDTRQTLILYSFVYLISFGSLPVMLVIANFLAFLGLFALFKTFRAVNISPLPAFIACFCIPSTLFWSSGLLKEVWLLLFMGFTLYSAMRFFTTKHIRFAAFALVWSIALLHVKIYIALCLLPLLALYAIRTQWRTVNAAALYGGACVLCIFVVIGAQWFGHFSVIEVLGEQRNTFIRMLEFQNHTSIILHHFNGSVVEFCTQLFVGLFNVALRPTVFDIQNTFMFFACLENVVIAALIVFGTIVWIQKRSPISNYTMLTIVFVVA
ncbi:MAG: hypothetical protein LBM68_00030, partial [Bacteroidales bacterium]|nr:hypothetical protein [Bacteroidales bacterium]